MTLPEGPYPGCAVSFRSMAGRVERKVLVRRHAPYTATQFHPRSVGGSGRDLTPQWRASVQGIIATLSRAEQDTNESRSSTMRKQRKLCWQGLPRSASFFPAHERRQSFLQSPLLLKAQQALC